MLRSLVNYVGDTRQFFLAEGLVVAGGAARLEAQSERCPMESEKAGAVRVGTALEPEAGKPRVTSVEAEHREQAGGPAIHAIELTHDRVGVEARVRTTASVLVGREVSFVAARLRLVPANDAEEDALERFT